MTKILRPRQREVWYTLARERDDKTVCEPIATYDTYLEALEDGLTFHNKRGCHMKIDRHSMPHHERITL